MNCCTYSADNETKAPDEAIVTTRRRGQSDIEPGAFGYVPAVDGHDLAVVCIIIGYDS